MAASRLRFLRFSSIMQKIESIKSLSLKPLTLPIVQYLKTSTHLHHHSTSRSLIFQNDNFKGKPWRYIEDRPTFGSLVTAPITTNTRRRKPKAPAVVESDDLAPESPVKKQIVGPEELEKRQKVLEKLTALPQGDCKILNQTFARSLTAADLESSLTFFLKELEFSQTVISRLLSKYPRIWKQSVESQLRPVVSFLLSVGVSKTRLETMTLRAPQVLCTNLEKRIKPSVEYLRTLGVDPNRIGQIISLGPEFLCCNQETNGRIKVAYFEKLGIPLSQMGRLVERCPHILSHYSIENNLEPSVKFLEEIGMTNKEIAKQVLRNPQVLAQNMERNLVPKMEFLEKYGLPGGKKAAVQILIWKPRIGLDAVKNKVRALENLGFTKEEVCEILIRSPLLLGYKSEVIEEKLNYLLNVMKRDRKEILHWPKVFEYSLTGRIIPRYKHLGVEATSIKLANMLVSTNETFESRYGPTIVSCKESDEDDVEALIPA